MYLNLLPDFCYTGGPDCINMYFAKQPPWACNYLIAEQVNIVKSTS